MVSATTLLKKFINVNNSIIDSYEVINDSSDITTLRVYISLIRVILEVVLNGIILFSYFFI